ncbi:DUF4398 domain-containing protein [Arenimonas sp.]|uniref:DUF4398 domain-containing protein n=1 Tax=Arenimonas sp. TaxID=1872635 RepID=UPI0039E2CFAE
MNYMALTRRKIYLSLALTAFVVTAFAATPPTADMAAAEAAIVAAERAQPRGSAEQALLEARDRYSQAQAAMGRKKYKDAQRLAQQATAGADLALARARLATALQDVEEKSTRNAEMRRQLLLQSGGER